MDIDMKKCGLVAGIAGGVVAAGAAATAITLLVRSKRKAKCTDEAGFSNGSTIASDSLTATYKVLQDRVIEVTYDSYDFDEGIAYLAEKYDNFEAGGCSAVKAILNGNVYVGRNYDFYCSDSPALVVRNNAGAIRTIGIGNSPLTLPAWTDADSYKVSEEALSVLPFIACDVMSEAGIYAETNIRVYEEELACASTNPGQPRRCTQSFMQTMLTQYGTIDEIISHIDDYDWFGLDSLHFCQSFFLTDKTGYSVCIEFAANSWKCSQVDYNANFFINDEYYQMEKYPAGEQRASRELAKKPFLRSEQDIFDMMGVASYAQFFSSDCEVDYAIGEFLEDLGYTRFDIADNMDDARVKMQEMLDKFGTYTWEDKIANKCWETTFCTVANVTDLTLDVHFSEHYGVTFKLGFEE